MEQAFRRSFGELERIFDFSDRFYATESIGDSHRFAVNLAIEEIFTNMVKYEPGNTHDIVIEFRRTQAGVEVSLTDFDVGPFDRDGVPTSDVDAPLEERRIGGLGLLLVEKLMDQVEYEYKDRNRTVRLTRRLE